MHADTYQRLAMRTKADQAKILIRIKDQEGHKKTQLLMGVIGLQDEVGELASCIKKHIEYGQPLDETNLKEEVGDCLWRLAQLCDAIGISLADCACSNIEKLKHRYKDEYSDFNAEEANRDRQQEREILEQNGQGWAEPPEEVTLDSTAKEDFALVASFGDGLKRELNRSYDRFCSLCHKIPIHRTNTSGLCPNCAADVRGGRKTHNAAT